MTHAAARIPSFWTQLLKVEKIYAVVEEDPGYDTGNIQSWLEANVSLALDSPEHGPALRASLQRMLGREAE